MSVCFFNSLPNGEYSNLLIAAPFSGKTSLPAENSYLLRLPDDKSEITAVFQSKIVLSFVLLIFVRFFLYLNGSSDDKVVSFTKNENCSLV